MKLIKKFFFISFVLFGVWVFVVLVSIVVDKFNKYCPSSEIKETNDLVNEDKYPMLPFELTNFSSKDVRSGSATYHKDYPQGDIRQYGNAYLKNEDNYQSYPTTKITLTNYSNRNDLLEFKPLEETLQKILEPSRSYKEALNTYQEWGKLITHYLPEYLVEDVQYFDVNNDGVNEMMVTYNYYEKADSGLYQSDIISNGKIIFSVNESNSRIFPSKLNDGFYVEWRIPNDDSALCCSTGYMKTRFIWKDGKFEPIYEQEIKYLLVGKED